MTNSLHYHIVNIYIRIFMKKKKTTAFSKTKAAFVRRTVSFCVIFKPLCCQAQQNNCFHAGSLTAYHVNGVHEEQLVFHTSVSERGLF